MEKKHGFVKPIYQRAKEVEETKKTHLETMKKTVDDKKAKKEEEMIKARIQYKNYNEKDFNDWRNHTLEWDNKKKKKIENKREDKMKHESEAQSKFFHPNVDKKSETIQSNKNISMNVHDKLYTTKDEKEKRLMQKIIESLPQFKPTINKKLPKYLQNKDIHYQTKKTQTETKTNTKKHSPIDSGKHMKTGSCPEKDVHSNYNTVSGFTTVVSNKKTADVICTVDSDEDDEDIFDYDGLMKDENVINQYKEALKLDQNDIENFDEKDQEKINKYSQKLASIISNINNTSI